MSTDRPSAVSGAFRRPFPQQVAFFRQKLARLVPTARWDDMLGAAHDHAFMVAGAQKADLLADLAAAVDRAIAEGTSLETFRKDFSAAVERHDWHGWTGEDTKGGRAWRTRTIYRTNSYVSYAAGRFAQLKAANWPLWVYRHGGSNDPRPEHLHVFDGLVLPPDHPFWEKFYPPSDWGCSCYVVGARSERGARRLGGDPDKRLPDGWDAVDPATGEPAGIGEGWGYAPGASVAHAVAVKVAGWDGQIAAAFLDDLSDDMVTRILAVTGLPRILRSVRQLTADEKRAFTQYTTIEGAAEINGALRVEKRLTPEADRMSQALMEAQLPATGTHYRGVIGDYAELLKTLEPGDTFLEAGFVSTSLRRRISEQFLREQPGGVLMIVEIPADAPALYIASISTYPHEEEVLIQHGQMFIVDRWDRAANVVYVRLVV